MIDGFVVSDYLQRLGIYDSVSVCENDLIRLTRAHLESIPFENLEVQYERREPSLEPAALFDKIITRKRGGYCFELNKLFYLLLSELGFECYPVPARVVHRRDELRPFSHRATVVTVNGTKWFIDVGFGGAGPKGAIRMDISDLQHIYEDDFFVTDNPPEYPGEYAVFRVDDGIADRVLVFKDMPWMEADFTILNSYYATYPRSPFTQKRILYRCTPDGWINLTERTLITLSGKTRQTVELQSEESARAIVENQFGLNVYRAN